MQLNQRRHPNAGRAYLHAGASGPIQHPSRHHDDYARLHFNMNELAAMAPLHVLASETSPVQRMPPVTNFDFLPDMGRMTA